jgi:hypothetical protein
MDMHSGGSQKEDFAYLYIEAPLEEATSIFYSRFNHNPYRVTCTCCGEDYSISSGNLTEISGYDRNLEYVNKDGNYKYLEVGLDIDDNPREKKVGKTLKEYFAMDNVAVIRASDIEDRERYREVPEEGYIWH